MRVNGEAIYGATASPIARPDWGRLTQKQGVVYLHVFDWPTDHRLEVERLPREATTATFLQGGERLPIETEGERHLLTLPAAPPDPIPSVIRLDFGE